MILFLTWLLSKHSWLTVDLHSGRSLQQVKRIAQAKGQLAGSKIAEKDLDNKSERINNMPLQLLKFAPIFALNQNSCMLGCTDKTVAGGLMELNFQFGRAHSECCVQFWTLEYKPHIHRLEQSSKQQVLRKKSSPPQWSNTVTGCPEEWWNLCLWK